MRRRFRHRGDAAGGTHHERLGKPRCAGGAGERPVPPWLEVISSQLRVLVHSIPARQVIDTPVQEQLIVEFYSKK